MELKNKVVIITGGSSGIGEATALLLAREGANVVISYKVNKSGAEKVVSQIEKFGAKVFMRQADLTIEKEAEGLVKFTLEKFNRVDILVNNAGGYIDGDEWDGTADIWTKSLEQNLVSVMNVSKYAIKEFQKQQSGVIISVASRHSISGQFDSLSYAAAKAGVVNITQAYAKLLFPYGRANSVSPGPVNCGYWLTAPKEELEETIAKMPYKKLLEPHDVASAIRFLVLDDKINGQNIVLDGGKSLV